METNESLLGRGVVAINERKLVGKVKGLVVDCDQCAVSHCLVASQSTGDALVLPFESIIAVGDTFVTIQRTGDFLPKSKPAARGALESTFVLVGVEVFTRTGNRVGTVAGYDVDCVTGDIATLRLEDGATVSKDSYVFFSPEFVFVDDGSKTNEELRMAGLTAEAEAEAEVEPEAEAEPEAEVEPESEVEEAADAEPEPEAAAEPEAEKSAEDELRGFIVGKALKERVVSKDGAFVMEAGAVIGEDDYDAAIAHDAALVLAMSVD